MRVLVIDDEPLMLRSLRLLLRQDGCEVVSATTTSEAHRVLDAEHFDVILCDLHLSDGDGVSFYAELAPRLARKVVFITGGASSRADSMFLARHRVVYKPFTSEELRSAIHTVAAA